MASNRFQPNPRKPFLFFLLSAFLLRTLFPTPSRVWGEEPKTSAVTEDGVIFPIDPRVYGKADTSKLTVWGFSQCGTNEQDPQVLDLSPDIDPRAWAKWDIWGSKVTDYSFAYPAACKSKGIVFIGGGTATVFFRDEAVSDDEFKAEAACDAEGNPTKTQVGFYRGSLASAAFRQRLIRFAEIQIDGGVDGLFFDEANSSTEGNHWAGDGGFDDAMVADFGHYLCVKHADLTPAQWKEKFDIGPEDHLDVSVPKAQKGRSFDYRGYLKRHGWEMSPLNAANPLEADWGHPTGNRPDPDEGTFTQDYPPLIYWQEILLTLRTYARQKYGKEILITSNGIFPFVDFQCVGLYDYNHDGPGGSEANYTPVKDGHLDGTVSLQEIFKGLKARSLRVTGRVVPVSLFIDWPTPNMDRYDTLALQERQDYWRMFAAEAYANGVYFSFHLKTTTGEPTATQLGMMLFFKTYSAFYRTHASLYHGAVDLDGAVTVSAPHVVFNLAGLPDGRTVLHLINHNYSQGFQTQKNLTVSFPLAAASAPPKSVTALSPDNSQEIQLKFSFDQGRLKVQVPELESYTALVAD
jgi:hypothetical protein